MSIPNDLPVFDSVAPAGNLYEGVAPILGILKTLDGNAQKADSTNYYMSVDSTNYYKMLDSSYRYYKVQPNYIKDLDDKLAAVLPLGWQISDYAISMMQASVKKQPQLCAIKRLFDDNFK